ncbi:MAG: MBL fold metallo-hydrolase [Flammeovirgaceae bacterium]
MKIEQLYTGCLAEAAYYIESDGEAAIIDPLRETEPYIELAKKRGTQIKYIFETHFHADFVSGHVDLAQKTGATIVYGPNAQTTYDIHQAVDGEEFQLGKIKFKALHTPGHTLESTTFLLFDENQQEHAIFSGDTLFIGDVGRPDLAIKSDLTIEDLAGMLYDSLRNKIMPLPNEVMVYPAHGAGSACGKNMSKETFDTLGNQKATNYALRADMTKEEFIQEVTSGILPPPQYFAKNANLNKVGYEAVDQVLARGSRALSLPEFENEVEKGALILDVRHQSDFIKGFIPKSLFVGIDGSFAVWVGTLIKNIEQPIVLITPEGREEETVKRLARVGYDNTLGFLAGGIETWQSAGKPIETLISASAQEVAELLKTSSVNLLDVRKPSEYEAEHALHAQSYPLDFINNHLADLDQDKSYHVYCRSGYRSVVACSILKAHGYANLVDVSGGFQAISQTDIERTQFVCPSTITA